MLLTVFPLNSCHGCRRVTEWAFAAYLTLLEMDRRVLSIQSHVVRGYVGTLWVSLCPRMYIYIGTHRQQGFDGVHITSK